jgi:ankyrin repeat protein
MKPRHLAAARAHTVGGLANLSPGLPALHVAILGYETQFMALLLEHSADPNQFCGAYPIQLAASIGSLDMVNILIEYQCEVNAARMDGNQVYYVRATDRWLIIRLPAICSAWLRRQFDIVESLWKAGARFPEHDQAMIRYSGRLQPLFCVLLNHKESGGIDSDNYFDPWVDAIRSNSITELCQTIQLGDKYIGHNMSTAHLARCISIHGTSNTLKAVKNGDLLGSQEILDPLILSALAYVGDEAMARKVTRTLIENIGRTTFVQRYGTRALFLAVVRAHQPLIQFFLEIGLSPFEQGLDFPDADLWRMDRWVHLEVYASFRRDIGDLYGATSNRPTEIVFQVWCATPFQAACLRRDEGVIRIFLAWEPAVRSFDFEGLRTSQLSAAYLNAVCSGNMVTERLIEKSGINLDSIKLTMDASRIAAHYRLGLQAAMNKKNIQLAKRLLDLGADGNTPATTHWNSPLQSAAANDRAKGIVRILLERGADPNAPAGQWDGQTALQYAASRGNFENVQLLIEAGGDINAPTCNREGYLIALKAAANNGRFDMTIFLLEKGADVKGRSNINYWESVRGAWAHGHHTLAETIQDWKKRRYGEEDCEPIESIVAPFHSPDKPNMSEKCCSQNHVADKSNIASGTDFVSSDSDSDSDSEFYSNGDLDSEVDDHLYVQQVWISSEQRPL